MKKTLKKVTKTPGSRAIFGTPYIDYLIGCKFSIPAGRGIQPNVFECRPYTRSHHVELWPIIPDKQSRKHFKNVSAMNGYFTQMGNTKTGKVKIKSGVGLNKVICVESPTFPLWVGKSYQEIIQKNSNKTAVQKVKETPKKEIFEQLSFNQVYAPYDFTINTSKDAYMSSNKPNTVNDKVKKAINILKEGNHTSESSKLSKSKLRDKLYNKNYNSGYHLTEKENAEWAKVVDKLTKMSCVGTAEFISFSGSLGFYYKEGTT